MPRSGQATGELERPWLSLSPSACAKHLSQLEAEAENITSEQIIEEILEELSVP